MRTKVPILLGLGCLVFAAIVLSLSYDAGDRYVVLFRCSGAGEVSGRVYVESSSGDRDENSLRELCKIGEHLEIRLKHHREPATIVYKGVGRVVLNVSFETGEIESDVSQWATIIDVSSSPPFIAVGAI